MNFILDTKNLTSNLISLSVAVAAISNPPFLYNVYTWFYAYFYASYASYELYK